MSSEVALAIRAARRAARVTQTQFAALVGTKRRAVSRWEKDEATPTRRVRARLEHVLQTLHPESAARLQAAFARRDPTPHAQPAQSAPAPAPAPAPAAGGDAAALELALFKFADDLDVPARRARVALARLLERLASDGFTLHGVQAQLSALAAATD